MDGSDRGMDHRRISNEAALDSKDLIILEKERMRMKRCMTWVFGILVVLAFIPPAVVAGEMKIGVVDVQKVISDSKEGKRLSEGLKKKKDELQQRLDTMQQDLVKMKEDLDKQGMMLSMDAKEDREKEYERKRREVAYAYEDIREEMRKAEQEAMQAILVELEKVVKDYGEKNGYTLVLERRRGGILTYDDAIEVTDDIIKAFDQIKK
jgi:outer membrane protein